VRKIELGKAMSVCDFSGVIWTGKNRQSTLGFMYPASCASMEDVELHVDGVLSRHDLVFRLQEMAGRQNSFYY
jgi:hypothetical protein